MAEVELLIPDKALACLYPPKRYKILYGGRGSAKSWSIAKMLIALAMQSKIRVLCTREFQKSIKDSVHRLLSDQIEAMGLSGYFEILQAEIKCTKTGAQFLFAGLATTTVEGIKSFEGCTHCWVEEAQTVSNHSWQILIPTIRAPKSEIWISFNPDDMLDPTYQRFILQPPPDASVVRLNWEDNPWFPEELMKEKDYLYSVDPESAAHVWGGECRRVSDAQILRGRYSVRGFEPVPGTWDGPYQGVDWGFATDPSVMVRCWIWEHDLYMEYEAYGLQVETDLLPSLFDSIPSAREYVTRSDNSRPESASLLQRMGYKRMTSVDKWPGSVKDGIEHLRSYQHIIIHPRCVQTAIEARLWSWKTDRLSGDVLPEVKPGNDHCWDAIRYALTPIILGWAKKVLPRHEEEDPIEAQLLRRSRVSENSWMG